MSTDDLFAPHGAFATDWLAQPDPLTLDGPTGSSESFDPDSLAFFADNPFAGLDGLANEPTKGVQPGLTQEQLARALMGGFDLGGDPPVGELSSTATSTVGGKSDVGSSPSSSGISHSDGLGPSPHSTPFDLDAVLGNSPSFSLSQNFACDFDTSALQDLFTNSSPNTTSGSSAYLTPYALTPYPLQMRSPASSVSPHAAPLPAFPPPPAFDSESPSTFDPAKLFASVPSSRPVPLAPRLSVDFASQSPPPASTSPAVTVSMPAAPPQKTSQPTFASLAAAAGVAVPPIQPLQSASSIADLRPSGHGPTVVAAASPTLSAGARGRTTRNRAEPLTPATTGSSGDAALDKPRARTSAEVICNAGLPSDASQAPLLQLNPGVDLPGMKRGSTGEGVPANTTVHEHDGREEEKPSTGKGGKKGKKSDRGHNAVEQKYRNSINNALATLRDTIPALRHLKPLPSMPVSKRKASQFTLASAAIPATPSGLVDGVIPAKTLSKGVILNKANEYIDYLRFARESRDADIELLKGMVRDMVGGGDALVAEFDRRREALETARAEERERAREEEEEDGSGEDEEDEEEAVAPTPTAKAEKGATAGTKRGRKADAGGAPAKKARGRNEATTASARGDISPPLTDEYQHVQALNQAHLDALAAAGQAQHVFPPSPVSSGDEQGVTPGAVADQGSATSGRVLLASFMGVSFAGGLGYDLAGSAVVAEETLGATAARVLTGRLVRRTVDTTTDASLRPSLIERLHPSLLSGLVALGAATVVVAMIYLVLPFFSRTPTVASTPASARARRRDRAIAALAVLSGASSDDVAYDRARSSALAARRELLRFVGAAGTLGLPFAVAKEACGWAARRVTGLTWARDGAGPSSEDVEEAVAWVRIAEIEASVGSGLAPLARMYTFLRLSNLSRSPAWPQVSPTTSRAAVDALLCIHLLALGHPRWAETRWSRTIAHRKKTDSPQDDSFVDLALASEWATVTALFAPESTAVKLPNARATPADTVPLLLVAEDACEGALQEAWSNIFIAVAESTARAPPSAQAAAESLASLADAGETADVVFRAMPAGTDLHKLSLMTKIFLACYRAGVYPSSPSAADDLVEARTLLAQLVLSNKESLAHFTCVGPLLRLLAPAVSGPVGAALSGFVSTPAEQASSDVDLLATVTLIWLLIRRRSAAVETFSTTINGEADEYEVIKPDPALHAQTLALRRLLGSQLFRTSEQDPDVEETEGEDDAARIEDAKELLVDALTGLARRAAGLSAAHDDDSGVELA